MSGNQPNDKSLRWRWWQWLVAFEEALNISYDEHQDRRILALAERVRAIESRLATNGSVEK